MVALHDSLTAPLPTGGGSAPRGRGAAGAPAPGAGDRRTTAEARQRGRRVGPAPQLWSAGNARLIGGAATLTVLVVADVQVPFARPALALWLLLLAPTRLLSAKVRWGVGGTERVVLSLAATVLGLLLGTLMLNTVLPLVGVARPLDPVPTVLAMDAALLGLLAWRPRLAPVPLSMPRWCPDGLIVPWPRLDVSLTAAATTGVVLAVTGAVRLNNGGDGAVAMLALVAVVGVFAVAILVRRRISERALHLVIYLQSLALLLMTSVRGWYITGHDIQKEFQVLQLTSAAGHWDVGALQDPYNACLSITLLPTAITGLTGGPLEGAFKIYTQLIFAVTPLVVYLIARRSSTIGISLLSVIFFVAFPTYFTDMPYLNRQEIAFVFLAVATLTILQTEIGVVRRRVLFAVFTTGTLLSHYSTTYVLIGVIAAVAVLRLLTAVSVPLLPARMRWLDRVRRIPHGRMHATRLVVGPVNILILVAMAFTWSNLLTHTDSQVVTTARQTIQEILHPGSTDARSSDITYNLFSGQRYDPVARLAKFRAGTVAQTATERARGSYLPLPVLDRYPLTLTQPPPLALTPLGTALDTAHISVSSINAAVRSGAAKLLQIFVCVGLIALALNAAARFKPPAEMVFLGVASFGVVASQVVLPQVSVDYGVLRAFQQALIVLAPFLATGAITCLRWLGRWADRVTAVFTLAFLASLTGLIPQLTGGYPPQLQLNNAGLYYDIYYPHEQELAAAAWLASHAGTSPVNVQYEVETDRYTANRLPSIPQEGTGEDIFPTLLRNGSYVLLGYTTVTQDRSVISYLGDQLIYAYPTRLLEQTKTLLYDNGGAQVYR